MKEPSKSDNEKEERDNWVHRDRITARKGKDIPVMGNDVHAGHDHIDITERGREEEAWRVFADLMEAFPASITIHDTDGCFLYVNQRTLDMHGYTREEFLALNVHDLDTPESERQIVERIRRLKAEREVSFEVTHRRKDGSEFLLLVCARMTRWGRRDVILSVATDITERKLTETALRQSEERFRTLFLSMSEGFYLSEVIYDDKGNPCDYRYLEVNPKFEQIIGLSHDQIVGKRYKELVPMDTTHWLDIYFKVALTGTPLNYEFYSEEYHQYFETFSCRQSKNQVAVFVLNVTKRKQVEESLRQANLVMENSQAMLFRWKAAEGWPIVLVSENVIQLGYTSKELLNGSIRFASMIHPADLQRIGREVMAHTESGVERFQQEYRMIAKDGRVRWVDDRTVVERDAEGRVTHYQGIVVDISERKQAEDILRRYELLVEQSRDIILFLRRDDGRILEANAAAAATYGYSRQELLTLSIRDLSAPETWDLTAEQMAKADAEGILFETIHRRKDGSTVPVEVSSRGATVGDTRTLVSVVRDITERKRAEEALRESETKFRSIVESSPTAMYFYHLETDGRLILTGANPSADRIIGISHNSLLGKTMEEAFPNLRDTGIPKIFRKVAKGEEGPQSFEIPYRDDRFSGFYDMHVFKTGPMNIAIDLVDISERKQAEENIRQLKEELERRVLDRTVQLEAAVKELEAFGYSVSHDLRSPLRTIDGFSQMVLEDYGDQIGEGGKEALGHVRLAAQRMSQLIDDMQTLSRLVRRDMQLGPVDLSRVVWEVVNELRRQDPARVVEFIIAKGVTTRGDSHLLQLTMQNLLTNAWKYTQKQSQARIEFGVATQEKNGKKVFYVQDNGAGFDMAYIDKLFKPFERLHLASDFAGSGIGLAIVKRIIERHGGEVWAEGEAGKGATFFFTI